MLIEASKKSLTASGSAVVIKLTISLNTSESISYTYLDKLLRDNECDSDVMDAVSDYGFSYSNDILTTIYWDRLDDLLKEVTRIVRRNAVITRLSNELIKAKLLLEDSLEECRYLWVSSI